MISTYSKSLDLLIATVQEEERVRIINTLLKRAKENCFGYLIVNYRHIESLIRENTLPGWDSEIKKRTKNDADSNEQERQKMLRAAGREAQKEQNASLNMKRITLHSDQGLASEETQ